MLHRATPTPVPIPNVLGVSLAWPNGRSSILVPVGALVPHPIALVYVDGPGRVFVQWRLDGAAFHTEFGRAKKAGDIRFELSQALPHRGTHAVSLVILQPVTAPLASPSPAPALRYSIGG